MFPELPASEFANGCWRSESSYEGSGVDADRGVSDVAVFVTLDAGASQFFSGVRLLMCCQGGERFKDLVRFLKVSCVLG